MKTIAKIGGAVAALMLAVSGAYASEQVSPYWHSSSGDIVKSGFGDCVRSGFWTPALAEANSVEGCACDADILDASVCSKAKSAPVAEVPQEKNAEKVTFAADMLFEYNRSELKPEGKAVLDDLMSQIAGVDIEVILSTGYADRIGSDKFNDKLSAKRAEAVKAYLVSKGVDANLIKAEGLGERDPVVNCPNPWKEGKIKNFKQLVQCLAPNRRAVVEVYGTRNAE